MLENVNIVGIVLSTLIAAYAIYQSKDFKNFLKSHK